MIEPHWKRIAGIWVQNEGEIGAVWLAHDKDADTLYLYDCCIFRLEVMAVIGEGINARGRWIPVAWEKDSGAICTELQERGCNMLHEPYKETDALAEMLTRDIWERMRTGRFKVDKRMKEWLDEYESFHREESQVPKENYPLQSATRAAVSQLPYARRQGSKHKQTPKPRIAMI